MRAARISASSRKLIRPYPKTLRVIEKYCKNSKVNVLVLARTMNLMMQNVKASIQPSFGQQLSPKKALQLALRIGGW